MTPNNGQQENNDTAGLKVRPYCLLVGRSSHFIHAAEIQSCISKRLDLCKTIGDFFLVSISKSRGTSSPAPTRKPSLEWTSQETLRLFLLNHRCTSSYANKTRMHLAMRDRKPGLKMQESQQSPLGHASHWL